LFIFELVGKEISFSLLNIYTGTIAEASHFPEGKNKPLKDTAKKRIYTFSFSLSPYIKVKIIQLLFI
jgi:hypothetical protein